MVRIRARLLGLNFAEVRDIKLGDEASDPREGASHLSNRPFRAVDADGVIPRVKRFWRHWTARNHSHLSLRQEIAARRRVNVDEAVEDGHAASLPRSSRIERRLSGEGLDEQDRR